MLQIFKISLSDLSAIDAIVNLQTQLTLPPLSHRDISYYENHGYLVSSYTRDDFIRYLSEGGGVYLARNTSHTVAGYLLHNPGTNFFCYNPHTKIGWTTPELERECNGGFHEGRFLYLDQIAVDEVQQGRGVARALLNTFESERIGSLIYSAVIESPLDNKRSKRFFLRNGYKQVGHFFTPEIKGVKNVRSAVMTKLAGS